MDQRIRPDSLSRERCNSHASRRVPLERQETGDSRRSISDAGECWVQESCQGGVVQYCNRATTPSQRNQGALEGQDLYDSMKRTMEKKLRENRQSYQDPFWNPLCKKEQEPVTKPKEIYPIKSPQLVGGRPISTKNELLRVYRESIRRGELTSLCMKTKRGRETLTLSVMVKSQEAQSPGCREEGFDCYVPPETFPNYLPMCSKTKADHSYDEVVQVAQSGANIVKHHHH